MIFILILFIIVVVIIVCCMQTQTGNAELVLNKTKSVNKHVKLGYANFESFLDAKKINYHLVCIIGMDLSGRSHLAKMLAKKYGYTVIDERDGKGKMRKIPDLRKEFYIANVPPDASISEAAQHKKRIEAEKNKHIVISGNFTEEDLGRLFKGNNYNRNFLLLYVHPKDGADFRWAKCTNSNKADYKKLQQESDQLLKKYKNYRIYIVQNDFNQ